MPNYGTWIRRSRVAWFAAATAVCLAGAVLALLTPWFLLFLVPLAVFGYITAILALTVHRLGPRGGDFQRRIHELIAAKSAAETTATAAGCKILDVGCGSGSLVVKLAKAHPGSTVTGIDSWGGDWEYSQRQCAENARIEGVADRTTFDRQSAAAIDFGDATFDVVVSCLTFHEIREAARKTDGVTEALRVLRPGGRYVFLDLFGDRGVFPDDPRGTIPGEFIPLDDAMALKFPLKHPKVLGHAVLIVGTKPPAGQAPPGPS
ncbi:class I SAM-dependent methyltransferase [Asanoa sp. NPDC050611]|uniref:class I SAM-dependent methyltransferase n=1 Tax=Asanoa sp. NPDC050611 TaxID=3157098 RepID=UPI0033F3D588